MAATLGLALSWLAEQAAAGLLRLLASWRLSRCRWRCWAVEAVLAVREHAGCV